MHAFWCILPKFEPRLKAGRGEATEGKPSRNPGRLWILVDAQHAIAHNKIMIIDGGATIITGSFNFTKAAENNNAENLLVLKAYGVLAEKYRRNYEGHRGHAEKYAGRTGWGEEPVRKRKR